MNQSEYKEAAEYWEKKDALSVKMPREELYLAIKTYLEANNTCALATGFGTFVRCTPIEYTYFKEAFYLFSEGGQKFVGLEHNDRVSLAIYDNYEGFGKIKGMQISGRVTILTPFTEEYNRVAEYKHISLEALRKFVHPMHLLRVDPERIEFLNSEFKEKGYGPRQALEFLKKA